MTARGRIARWLLLIALLTALMPAFAPGVSLAPPPVAAATEIECGEVMQSVFDIAPIERCGSYNLHPTWMTDNADRLGQRPLSQVVMAGAHDALTGLYDKNAPGVQWLVQDQDLNLWGLLQYGVRSFDMRFCTPADDPTTFHACHGGFFDPKVTPANMIDDLQAFTNAHPQEILIISWTWQNPIGDETKRKDICANFFNTFRNIMVSPDTVNGETTLEEIWSMPNQPRIIFSGEFGACDPYFADGTNYPEGPSDESLDWIDRFYGGQWANSPFGDLNPDLTGLCGLVLSDANIDLILEQSIGVLGGIPGVREAFEPIARALLGGAKCTDVATANTQDLTSNLDPTKLNTTQAVVTATAYPQIIQGHYALTVGTPGVPSQFPAVGANLVNLWNNNTDGARPRFNIIAGDFVQHTGLVEGALAFNKGPLIEPDLVHSDDGTPYIPGQGNWSNGLTLNIGCLETEFFDLPPNSLNSFPVDWVTVVGAGIDRELSGPGPWTVELTTPVSNGAVTIECVDTSGKIARTTISGININGAPVVDAGSETTIDEGSELSLLATFTDEPGGTHDATIIWGDATTESGVVTEPDGANPGTVAGGHIYADDASHTVTVCVTDVHDQIGCDSLELTVNNIAPSANPPAVDIESSDEGQSVVASATFSDPGTLDTHTCTVDYGDGSDPVEGTVTGTTCTGPAHTYLDDDPSGTASDDYPVTIVVTDDDGGSGDNTSAHTVDNVPPTIDSITTNGPVPQGQPVTVTVAASDVGINDMLTYLLDCDKDGTYETAGTGNQASCALDPAAASTTIGAKVSDDDGGVTTDSVVAIQTLTLCLNYAAGTFSGPTPSGGCAAGTTPMVLTAVNPVTLCINPYTGAIGWSPSGSCSSGQRPHLVPGSGPLAYCQHLYTNTLRQAWNGQCTSYERAGVIPG